MIVLTFHGQYASGYRLDNKDFIIFIGLYTPLYLHIYDSP
jgi:hypothetical protein